MPLPKKVAKLPLRVRMQAAIEKLETRERQVLSLMLLEGLTALETAGTLGIPVREAQSLYKNAIDTIAAETQPHLYVSQRRAA